MTLKPRATASSGASVSPAPTGVSDAPTSPRDGRRVRPGWKPTIVRQASLVRLRAIQKSTVDPALDLSYLSDACVQLALELGADAIVRRALADLQPKVATT